MGFARSLPLSNAFFELSLPGPVVGIIRARLHFSDGFNRSRLGGVWER